jgi:hypothetical protein
MSSAPIRLKMKIGANEVEIEAPPELWDEAMERMEQLLDRFSQAGAPATQRPAPAELPSVKIDAKMSLTEMLERFFSDPWGSKPRRLGEVRAALHSYGLTYPRSSVAVALLRLAQAGKIRRFKEGNEFVYVSVQPSLQPAQAEAQSA